MVNLTIVFIFIIGFIGSALLLIMNTMSRSLQRIATEPIPPAGRDHTALGSARPLNKPGQTARIIQPEEATERVAPPLTINYASFPGNWSPASVTNLDKEKITEINTLLKKFMDLRAWIGLNSMMRSAHSDVNDIARHLSTMPLLSEKILQTINSSYFGLSTRVESVERAVTLLGYDNLKSIVLENGLHVAFADQDKMDQETFNRQWLHATAVATCAQYLATRLIQDRDHDYYTLGLLHDIGGYLLPLLKNAGPVFPARHPVIREEKRYGINHAQLGGLIINNWHLPENAAAIIEYHHHPQFCPPAEIPARFLTPAFILCLADTICKILDYPGRNKEIFPIRGEYFKVHGLSDNPQEIITADLVARIDKACRTVDYRKAA